MRTLIFSITLLLSTTTFALITEDDLTLYYASGQYQLKSSNQSQLDELIGKIKPTLTYEIKVSGHTDDVGTNTFNDGLSMKRANAVARYLKSRGINPVLVHVEGHGELVPDKPNNSDEQRRLNRRVEVTLVHYKFDQTSDLDKALQYGCTFSYTADNSKGGGTIVTKNGIRIAYSENSFVYTDGSPVTEPVNVTLTEALDYQSFLAHGLATISNGQLLESGGMFKIDATTASGKAVKINPEDPIFAAVPTTDRKNDMEVFLSDTDGRNWETTSQQIVPKVRYSPPPLPQRLISSLPIPEFDASKYPAPKAPVKPREPNEPHPPREESYRKKPKWYQFLRAKKIKERGEKNYENAMAGFEKRSDKYDDRMTRHGKRMLAYNDAVLQHESDMDCWKEDLAKHKQDFMKTPEFKEAWAKRKKHQAALDVVYKEKLEAWKKKKDKMVELYAARMDKLGITDANSLNNYVFAVNNLKWINVDRFYKGVGEEQRNILVKGGGEGDAKVMLAFTEMNSMLPLDRKKNGTYCQRNIPKGPPVYVFAYRIRKGKPEVYFEDATGKGLHTLEFRKSTFSEIKKILEQLQSGSA